MLPFTEAELESLSAANLGAMQDRCLILQQKKGVADAYGKKAITYPAGPAYPCGVGSPDTVRAGEVMGEAQVPRHDIQLRLPLGAQVKHVDRVQITHRYGQQLNEQPIYTIVGLPQRGPTGLQVKLLLLQE